MKQHTAENVPMHYHGIAAVVIVAALIFTRSPQTIVGGLVGIICAHFCYKWAARVDSSSGLAYVLGFLFGLFGLLGYYIFYRTRRKK